MVSLSLDFIRKCSKWVVGKKNAIGDKPATRRHQQPLSWDRLPFATEPMHTTQDMAAQRTAVSSSIGISSDLGIVLTHGSRSSSFKFGMRMVLRLSPKTTWTDPMTHAFTLLSLFASFLLFLHIIITSSCPDCVVPLLPLAIFSSCRIVSLSHPAALHNLNLNYMHGLM